MHVGSWSWKCRSWYLVVFSWIKERCLFVKIVVLVSLIDFQVYIILFHTVVRHWIMIVFDLFGNIGFVYLVCLGKLWVIVMLNSQVPFGLNFIVFCNVEWLCQQLTILKLMDQRNVFTGALNKCWHVIVMVGV